LNNNKKNILITDEQVKWRKTWQYE